MATFGVLTYTLPHGLKLKSSYEKLTSISGHNNNNSSNFNNNTIVKKSDNPTMIGSDVLVMRRKQKLVPLTESNTGNVQSKPPAKKSKMEVHQGEMVGLSVGHKKQPNPLPQSVARRNARERNRVKQVNNGFAALRQHIPEEVAVAFEAAGNGRGNNKKLSKVETLRMAVEYIRSLERLLEFDTTSHLQNTSNFSLDSISDSELAPVIKTESCSSSIDDHYSESNYDPDESTIYYTDTLPDITTVNGQQYLRIPGTNTYQLITSEVFENEENIQPIPLVSAYGLDPQLTYITTTATLPPNSITPPPSLIPSSSMLNQQPSEIAISRDSNTTTTSISTEIAPMIAPALISPTSDSNYSGSGQPVTLSPVDGNLQPIQAHPSTLHHHRNYQQFLMGQLQMQQNAIRIKSEAPSIGVYQCHLARADDQLHQRHRQQDQSASSSPILDDGQASFIDAQLYEGVITFKRRVKQESVILETTGLSEESMMEAIDWWDSNTPQSDESVQL